MYGWYAEEDRMRANVGIRRRLAPLIDASRAETELINALLLSLPGSPCLYYGDEIGMQGYRDPFNRAFFCWDSHEERLRPVLAQLAQLRGFPHRRAAGSARRGRHPALPAHR